MLTTSKFDRIKSSRYEPITCLAYVLAASFPFEKRTNFVSLPIILNALWSRLTNYQRDTVKLFREITFPCRRLRSMAYVVVETLRFVRQNSDDSLW